MRIERLPPLLDAIDLTASPVVGRHAGLALGSAFQPIYSLSHSRIVGHEALVRATDATGRPVPPNEVFAVGNDIDELLWRDRLTRVVHLANYFRDAPPDQWLFLNVHPRSFADASDAEDRDFWLRLLERYRVPGHRLVIEITEDPVHDVCFEAAIAAARQAGCLIALDDFGAGHSNFERIWTLKPDIVKLDRSLIARATADRAARRVVSQMVSLLHECGTLVLMEGVETQEEAVIALQSDADLVQGYYFGRPAPTLATPAHTEARLDAVWAAYERDSRADKRSYAERTAPYINAIGHASASLAAGRDMASACAGFLALPGAEVCYLLGPDGRQVGHHHWAGAAPATTRTFTPLLDSRGARWSRRPYFSRAMQGVGKVQMTRPYRTLHGGGLCVTVSVAYAGMNRRDGERDLHVVCGDVSWE